MNKYNRPKEERVRKQNGNDDKKSQKEKLNQMKIIELQDERNNYL